MSSRSMLLTVAVLTLVSLLLVSSPVSAFIIRYTGVYVWNNASVEWVNENWHVPDFKEFNVTPKNIGNNSLELIQHAVTVPPKESAYYVFKGVSGAGQYPKNMTEVATLYAKMSDSIYELAINLASFVNTYMHYNYSDIYNTKNETVSEVWLKREGVCRDYSLVTRALLSIDGVQSEYLDGIIYGNLVGHMALIVNDYGVGINGSVVRQHEYIDPTVFNLPLEFNLMGVLWVDYNNRFSDYLNIPSAIDNLYRINESFDRVSVYYYNYTVNINGVRTSGLLSKYGGFVVGNKNKTLKIDSILSNYLHGIDIKAVYFDYYPAGVIVPIDTTDPIFEPKPVNVTKAGTINATLIYKGGSLLLKSRLPIALLDSNGKMIPFVKDGQYYKYLYNGTAVYLPNGIEVRAIKQGTNNTPTVIVPKFTYRELYVFKTPAGYNYVVEFRGTTLKKLLNDLSGSLVTYDYINNNTVVAVISGGVDTVLKVAGGSRITLSPDRAVGGFNITNEVISPSGFTMTISINPVAEKYFIDYSTALVNNVSTPLSIVPLSKSKIQVTFSTVAMHNFNVLGNNAVVYGRVFNPFQRVTATPVCAKVYADYRNGKFAYFVNLKVKVGNITIVGNAIDSMLPPGTDVTIVNEMGNVLDFIVPVYRDGIADSVSVSLNIFGHELSKAVPTPTVNVILSSPSVVSYVINPVNKTISITFKATVKGSELYSSAYAFEYLKNRGTVNVNGHSVAVSGLTYSNGIITFTVTLPLKDVIGSTALRLNGVLVPNSINVVVKKDYGVVTAEVFGVPTIGNVTSNVNYTIDYATDHVSIVFNAKGVDTVNFTIGGKQFNVKVLKPPVSIQIMSMDTVNDMVSPNTIYSGYKHVVVKVSTPTGMRIAVMIDGKQVASGVGSVVFNLPHLSIGSHVMTVYVGGIPVQTYPIEVIKEPLKVTVARYSYYFAGASLLILLIILVVILTSGEDPVTKTYKMFPGGMITYYKRRGRTTLIVVMDKFTGEEYLLKFVGSRLVGKKKRSRR